MRLSFRGAALAIAMGSVALPAFAEAQSEMLYQHKHWQVEVVGFDDGTFACSAAVDGGNDSFTIWVYQDKSVKLQFYSTSWDFGEGQTADLQVKIGSRSPWNLTGAELYKNSVLFNLPDSDQGVNFLVEVAQGSRLYLRTDSGEPVIDYSLAGSNASINALVQCSDALSSDSDQNPFN
jgi:hypothetical protein